MKSSGLNTPAMTGMTCWSLFAKLAFNLMHCAQVAQRIGADCQP
jgi:hypothetical protein